MQMPKYTRNYVKPQANINAGAGAQLMSQALDGVADVATKVTNIKDSTTAMNELSSFNLETTNKLEDLSRQYANNPDEFKKQATQYINDSSINLSEKSDISFLNKPAFEQNLNNTKLNLEQEINSAYRKLQVQKIGYDVNSTVDNNNKLSYKQGLNSDFNTFKRDLEKNSYNISLIGESVYNPYELLDLQSKSKTQDALNYMYGQISKDPSLAKQLLNDEVFTENLDLNTRSKLLKEIEDIEKRVSKQNALGVNSEKIIAGNKIKLELDTLIDIAEVKNNGKIKNEKFDNLDTIIDFNNQVEANKNVLSQKEYNNYKNKVYTMSYQQSEDFKGKKFYEINPTAKRKTEIYMNEYMSPYNQLEKTQAYIDILTEAKQKGLDINSNDSTTKAEILKITRKTLGSINGINPEDKDFDTKLKTKTIDTNNKKAYNTISKIEEKKRRDPLLIK